MDAVSRGRRLVLSGGGVVAFAAAMACAARPAAPVGFSPEREGERSGETPSSSDRGTTADSPSPVWNRGSGMVRLTGPFSSLGHAERFEAVLWGNEAARMAWTAKDPMPVGATLAEELSQRDRRGTRPAGVLLMEKRADAWRFTAADPTGHDVAEARPSACASCHRDAPEDSVFLVR